MGADQTKKETAMNDPPNPRSLQSGHSAPANRRAFAFRSNRMTNHPGPTTNATPADKLETLLNDKRMLRQQKEAASTFHQFGQSEASEEGGRWAKPMNVVGATPAPEYPRQPEGSWTNDPVPTEPPLGFVDEAPIVG